MKLNLLRQVRIKKEALDMNQEFRVQTELSSLWLSFWESRWIFVVLTRLLVYICSANKAAEGAEGSWLRSVCHQSPEDSHRSIPPSPAFLSYTGQHWLQDILQPYVNWRDILGYFVLPLLSASFKISLQHSFKGSTLNMCAVWAIVHLGGAVAEPGTSSREKHWTAWGENFNSF